MKIKVSDYIAKFIEKQKVKQVFLISGGANLTMIDSIAKNKKISYVCNHHEQASSIAAEGYSRVTENLGVCIVTTGPAGTNTLTGIMGAWTDSIPVLFIAGQVKRRDLMSGKLRQFGVQEVNMSKMAKPITKYSTKVLKAESIAYHLDKAVFLAKSGRPGPVLLEIPIDIQASMVDTKDFKVFDSLKEKIEKKPSLTINVDKNIVRLLKILESSSRPLIIAGKGIGLAKARKEIKQLIKKLNIPVITSMNGHDLIPTDDPLYVGRHGVFGNRPGNFAVQKADLIITIGARNHLWNIGYNWESFAPHAKKVIVDIDKAELNKKSVKPDLSFNLDAKDFLKLLLKKSSVNKPTKYSSWIKKCQNWKDKYPVLLDNKKISKKHVNTYHFTEILSKLVKNDEIIFTGVGTSFTGTNQSIILKGNQRLHYNVGCASMGWGLPAVVGASFANDKKRTILITGDGSLMMNLQELETVRHHNLPIKIFLYNNEGYSAIKNTQNAFYKGDLNAVNASTGVSFPDFKKIAYAFDIDYIEINNHSNLEGKVKNVLNHNGPIICELKLDPNQTLFPKVHSMKNKDGSMSSASLENMYPFLSKEELDDALDIKE